MSKKSTAWFFEDPMDFEYKKYKLLANVEFAEKSLNEGNIHDAMDFIEDHLVCFYRFQTDQEIRQIGNSEIIGVDPIMMDLIYKKGGKDTRGDIKILSDIAELGILEFEALHSLFRVKWRHIDDAITMTHVPQKQDLLSNGYAFLSCEINKWTRLYYFHNPEGVTEWKNFEFTFQKEVDYNKDFIMDFVNSLKEKTSDLIFINARLSKECQSKRAIDFVLACKVYYKLQKDFLF
jgi:hypothetical protein